MLFFDEFDVVGKERGDLHETGEIKRVVSSLLLQIDTLPSYVVAVSATNHPELLDRAVWRRFQLRLALPAPTSALAREWFRRFEQRLGSKLVPTPSTLARHLRGLSFAELEQFGLDVQRHHVLNLPEGDLRGIVARRLNSGGSGCRLPRPANDTLVNEASVHQREGRVGRRVRRGPDRKRRPGTVAGTWADRRY